MRISTSQIYDTGMRTMAERQQSIFRTQQQLSSGLRIIGAQDDPVGMSRIMDLDKDISIRTQYQSNISYARARLNQEDTALDSTTNLLQRVRELAVRAANDTMTSSDRLAISYEVGQLRDELFGLANTQNANGEFIFGGYQGDASPAAFSFDPSGNVLYVYNGDLGRRQIQISDSRYVADADNGFRVFERIVSNLDRDQTGDGNPDSTRSAFETLDMLAKVLSGQTYTHSTNGSGNDPNDIASYLGELDNILGNVLDIRAEVGGRLNALDEQENANESLNYSSEAARSQVRDLDYVEAISRYQQDLTALDAAQKSFSKINGMTLFNYI